jgi:hypothetical protein
MLTGAARDSTITTIGAAHVLVNLGGWALEQAGATLRASEQPGGPHPALGVYADIADALRGELRAVPVSAPVEALVQLLDRYLADVAAVIRGAARGEPAALASGAASVLESAARAHDALLAVMVQLGPLGAGSEAPPSAGRPRAGGG